MSATTMLTPADCDLLQRIRSFLVGRNYPALQDLDVEVYQGAVVISGSVESFHEKQLATNCCQRVAGVLQVINNISVTQHRVDDAPEVDGMTVGFRLRRRK